MIHVMDETRRAAFDLMRRQNLRADARRERVPLIRTYFRDDVMDAGMADALEDLGWLTVISSRRRRLSVVQLTEIGAWILGGAR